MLNLFFCGLFLYIPIVYQLRHYTVKSDISILSCVATCRHSFTTVGIFLKIIVLVTSHYWVNAGTEDAANSLPFKNSSHNFSYPRNYSGAAEAWKSKLKMLEVLPAPWEWRCRGVSPQDRTGKKCIVGRQSAGDGSSQLHLPYNWYIWKSALRSPAMFQQEHSG